MDSIEGKDPCLTCKRPITGLPICLDSSDPDDTISNRHKLKILVPEWELVKNKEYMMCWSCSCNLLSSYKFRMLCLSAASVHNANPAEDIKIEPEDIDDKTTKISNMQNLHLPATVEPLVVEPLVVEPLVVEPMAVDKSAVTEDVQKQSVLVVVKSNNTIQKPTVPIANKLTKVPAILKKSQNNNTQKLIQIFPHKSGPSNVIFKKQNAFGGTMFLKKIKPPITIRQIPTPREAMLSNTTIIPILAKPKPMETDTLSSTSVTQEKLSITLESKDAVQPASRVCKPVIRSKKQNLKEILDCPDLVVIDTTSDCPDLVPERSSPTIGKTVGTELLDATEPPEKPKINDKTKMDSSHIVETIPVITRMTTRNAQKTSGINKTVSAPDKSEADEQRYNRKLIMKSLYKAVKDSKDSGVTLAKRPFKPWEPEKNLSETIVKNWKKNISYLVRNDMMHHTSVEMEIEEEHPDEVNQQPELISTPLSEVNKPLPEVNEAPPEVIEAPPEVIEAQPEVIEAPPEVIEAPPEMIEAPPKVNKPPPKVNKSPPKVNKPPPIVNRPLEVIAPTKVYKSAKTKALEENKLDEVKSEIKSESDDVEFVSETLPTPSTSRSNAKSKLLEDRLGTSLIDLPLKGKTTFLCKCNHCGLLLTSKETLVKHIRQHFKNNPVQCDQCKTQFGDISSYNAHMCVYEKIQKAMVSEFEPECPKPKECKCNLYFGNIRTLNIHLETTCENSMFCMTCNMGFDDSTSTECHLRNVHNLFLCQLCRKMFRDKKYLMTHLHVMHEKKASHKKNIYRCPFKSCKKTCKFSETYELHLTYKHQEYYSNIYWEDNKTSYVTYMCNICKNNDKQICLNLMDQKDFIEQLQKNHSL